MADNSRESRSVIEEARKRFDSAWEADQDNRREALNDTKFAVGEQWPDHIRQEFRDQGRPCLTMNHMLKFVNQVTGDIRQNKPSIKIRPADDEADKDVADIQSGLIRHIESHSDAQIAYQSAGDSAAFGGIGWFRVVSDYSTPETFDQDILIKPIYNPFSVFVDPDARHPTRRDARYMFVTQRMQREAFEEEYPDALPVDWDGPDDSQDATGWINDDGVRVVEYWWKKPITKKLGRTADGAIWDITGLKPEQMVFLSIVEARDVPSHEIWHAKLTSKEVLEKPEKWTGQYFPIVAVIGNEVHVGDRVVRHGVIRFAKDAQQSYNYWRTAHTEQVALQPKAPYKATPDQMKGFEKIWKNANKNNLAVLPYNADPQAPGAPQREIPPQLSSGMMQEIAIAVDDMKATTGIFDAALGERSNETSGRAIRERRRESDVGTSSFPDNLAASIRQCGRVIVDLIPTYYDAERTIRILNEDDTEEAVPINQMVETEDGERVLNDMTVGKYDVVVATGPNFTTRRIEAAESMMAFIQALPPSGQIIMDLVAKNMDWPGADEIATRLRKALPPGLAETEEDEKTPEQVQAEQQQQQEAEALKQLQFRGMQAEVRGTEAKAQEGEAKADKASAETAKTLQEMQISSPEFQALLRAAIEDVLTDVLPQQSASGNGATNPNAAQTGL